MDWQFVGLKVKNSLTQALEDFVPQEGKQVKWYICGPTVYDASHLGHARTYLSFDIIRRILEDYFGYDVHVCMNITDIEDKIILRSRKNHLYAEYVQKVQNTQTFGEEDRKQLEEAILAYVAALTEKEAAIAEDVKSGKRKAAEAAPELNLAKEKKQKGLNLQTRLVEVLPTLVDASVAAPWLKEMEDPLCDYLDKKFGKSLPTDVLNKISRAHSAFWEAEFMADMKALGIKTPDTLTRVTEYVPEIIEMCERILANGFAYVSNNSVYFDVAAFDKANDHFYAKLVPSAYGNTALLDEGEGSLSADASKLEKRSKNDFALWKSSQAGEPIWDSPWGPGRPGWHIECSAMAGKVLGSTLDIHAGGCDLRFPHHDNELAQSEAYFNNKQWVNYFLHTGHLHIDNLKMSKSLKNFITIREMLGMHSARHIRFLFLLQSWDNNMNFQRVDTMKEVLAKEKSFNEFFLRVEHVLGERTVSGGASNEHWDEKDTDLSQFIVKSQEGVHKALCDNFDTAGTLKWLSDLVTKANSYMEKNGNKKAFLLKKAAIFVTRILRVFGLIEGHQEFGFDQRYASVLHLATLNEPKVIAEPYIAALLDFIGQVQNNPKVNSAILEELVTKAKAQLQTQLNTLSTLPSLAGPINPIASIRDIARPFVAILAEFRKEIRDLAKLAKADGQDILKLTDQLRDDIMPLLDVRIADDGEFSFVFQAREELEKEKQERIALESSIRRAKIINALQRKEKDLEKWKEALESPKDAVKRLYKVEIDAADSPLPENDSTGSKLSKAAAKDIKKLWTKQETAHKKINETLATDPDFLTKLEKEVNELKSQL